MSPRTQPSLRARFFSIAPTRKRHFDRRWRTCHLRSNPLLYLVIQPSIPSPITHKKKMPRNRGAPLSTSTLINLELKNYFVKIPSPGLLSVFDLILLPARLALSIATSSIFSCFVRPTSVAGSFDSIASWEGRAPVLVESIPCAIPFTSAHKSHSPSPALPALLELKLSASALSATL
jgi:hypothetical protein